MTQRIHSSAIPRAARTVQPVASAPDEIELACRWAYMAVCLLAIGAAGAIALGEAGHAGLRFAAVAMEAPRAAPAGSGAATHRISKGAKAACLHLSLEMPLAPAARTPSQAIHFQEIS
ncbi:hypothetical protein [Variovorax sp. DAIF25]|uniref:hypothetical protein n=1 Tax=Variovorax sp. DAIF25 TaxID=3080983 RepID=UPI003D6B74F2